MPILGLLLALVLSSCASRPPEPPPAVDRAETRAPVGYPNARLAGHPATDLLAIQESSLQVRAYRAGRLQHLGHNHILSSAGLTGLIHWPMAEPAPRFAHLYLAADSFIVDDPALRNAAGSAFSSKPNDADRAGTRRNMLGPKVLNAGQYPWIELLIRPAVERSTAAVTIALAGHRSEAVVPLTVVPAAGRHQRQVTFRSTFRLSHSQLGLTPFSALAGALRVAQELEFDLHLTAVASHSVTVQ